jgi:DNA-directed RNA polymerase subunit beta'
LVYLPKKLETIIYYERYVVIQAGIREDKQYLDLLTEEEYLEILEQLPKDNQHLDDMDPKKFVAKMGAEACRDLLARINLNDLSYQLRHQAANETSQQRKN